MPLLDTANGALHYFDSGLLNTDQPTLLLLHSSGASHLQWRKLIQIMPREWRVLASDLIGYGATPMPPGRQPSMADEVARLAALLNRIGRPLPVIAHSYGGAVALALAQAHPDKVSSLVLYEPAAFRVLPLTGRQEAWAEIEAVAERHVAQMQAGDAMAAAASFIDYWIAPGAFAAMPEAKRDYVLSTMTKVAAEWLMLLGGATARADWASLELPVRLFLGERSTLAARGTAEALAELLPRATLTRLPKLGHMAPVLQPELINPLLLGALSTRALAA